MKPLRLLLFFATLFFCIKSYSQENKSFAGFKAGVNYSTSSFEYYDDVNYKIGICTGLNFGYRIHKNILLLIEAVYDQQGCKIPIEFTDNVGNPIGKGVTIYTFNYATIPFSINYSPGSKKVFEAGIGIDNSFLLAAHYKFPNVILQGQSLENIDIKDGFKVMNLGFL
jgi:outer membrane protein with beta-barrel domain